MIRHRGKWTNKGKAKDVTKMKNIWEREMPGRQEKQSFS